MSSLALFRSDLDAENFQSENKQEKMSNLVVLVDVAHYVCDAAVLLTPRRVAKASAMISSFNRITSGSRRNLFSGATSPFILYILDLIS